MKHSKTETLAERALSLAVSMRRREKIYGYVCLTKVEYQTVVLEREVRQRTRDLSLEQIQAREQALTDAWYKRAERKTRSDALMDWHIANTTHQYEEWGIQATVARRIGVTRQTVHETLHRASLVMYYMVVVQQRTELGWRQGVDGAWWLAVPVERQMRKTCVSTLQTAHS